jgi:hypothetical protein
VFLRGHLSELRRSVSEHRIRRQTLWTGLALGLAVHVAGFLLKSSAPGEPIAVLADLLYALGWALWTGVVVAALVEIIPKAKERQISRYLDSYEAALRSRAQAAAGAGAPAVSSRATDARGHAQPAPDDSRLARKRVGGRRRPAPNMLRRRRPEGAGADHAVDRLGRPGPRLLAGVQ